MQLIELNPNGKRPILASTAADRIGVARTAIVSAILGGHVTGARKIDGKWHLEPGATWTRHPVSYNAKYRDRLTTTPNHRPQETTNDAPTDGRATQAAGGLPEGEYHGRTC